MHVSEEATQNRRTETEADDEVDDNDDDDDKSSGEESSAPKDWVALRSLTGLNVSGWKFQVCFESV